MEEIDMAGKLTICEKVAFIKNFIDDYKIILRNYKNEKLAQKNELFMLSNTQIDVLFKIFYTYKQDNIVPPKEIKIVPKNANDLLYRNKIANSRCFAYTR